MEEAGELDSPEHYERGIFQDRLPRFSPNDDVFGIYEQKRRFSRPEGLY